MAGTAGRGRNAGVGGGFIGRGGRNPAGIGWEAGERERGGGAMGGRGVDWGRDSGVGVAPFQGLGIFCYGSPGAMPQAGIGCSFGASGGWCVVWVWWPFQGLRMFVMVQLGRCPGLV